jgi:hypothetical protein
MTGADAARQQAAGQFAGGFFLGDVKVQLR